MGTDPHPVYRQYILGMWLHTFIRQGVSGWLCCPAVFRACCDTVQTCWGSWKRCCSSRPFWAELLSRNRCWRWSSSLTIQTALWVLHCFVNVLACLGIPKHPVFLPFLLHVQYAPSVTAVIEILSSKVQIYSSQLYIRAHFTGLR